jgi:asparagine synthase (glutamine-hydrolysing)
MAHRGPDSVGEWWTPTKNVGLGHRRLAIIDLSTAGDQPMHNADCGIAIVFNGEIYNYKKLRNRLEIDGLNFKTSSDTEVILNSYMRWGDDCLRYLEGMFAFAIYDSRDNSILIGRDRAGEKPLFYSKLHKNLIFSSELKGMIINPLIDNEVDKNSIYNYFRRGFIPGDKSAYKNIAKLKPGHLIKYFISEDVFTIKKYWFPPKHSFDKDKLNLNQLTEELHTLLSNSIESQLAADVPVGILLSGGLDSSLITAIATKFKKNIMTFNVSFPGEKSLDESTFARYISQNFGTNHHELIATPPSPEQLIILSTQFDEPFADSSMLATSLLFSKVSNYCKVVLGGDGGDELFGGYSSYSRKYIIHRYLQFIPVILRKKLSDKIIKYLPYGLKGRNLIHLFGSDFNDCEFSINEIFDDSCIKKILPGSFFNSTLPLKSELFRYADIIESLTQSDFSEYLPNDILVKVDRASMLNSLEVRTPFLDKNIIEFALSKVPSNFKVNHKKRKILLQELAKKVLPCGFNLNRKQGFTVPLKSWLMNSEFRNFSEDIIMNSETINKSTAELLFKQFDNGYTHGDRLFCLLMFELWMKNNKNLVKIY